MKSVMLPLMLLAAMPASAQVVSTGDSSIVISHKVTIAASPDKVWTWLVRPATWWSAEHSYSGDAANITIDARAGGCWCEKLADGGSVEHMRVVYVEPRKTLRFSGGLGPLQSMPVNGVLTIVLRPVDGATEVSSLYALSGSTSLKNFAEPVDKVLAGQWERLKAAVEKKPGG